MSDNHSTVKSVAVGVAIGMLTLMGIAAFYSYRNPTPIEQLLQMITGTQEEVRVVVDETIDTRQNAANEVQDGLQDIAEEIMNVESPAARFALVKTYMDELRAVLTPDSRKELDAIIVYVERNPVVLVQPETLPATYSASLEKIRQELLKSAGTATVVFEQPEKADASPSAVSPTPRAVVGQSYTLTGTLSSVESDPLLGGTYFVMTNTNYGEPFYLYLTGSQVPVIQETMVGQIVTVEVEVTSIEDGFVRYLVLSGPELASAADSAATTSSASANTP